MSYFIKNIILILLLVQTTKLLSQNLVPNHSLEEVKYQSTSMLDTGLEFAKVNKLWKTSNLASTDLITPRFRTAKFDPIPAHSGKNMAGLVIHGDFWAEYLKVQLKDTLQIGTEYYVEFWVAYCRSYKKDEFPRKLNPYFGVWLGDNLFIKDNKIIEKKPQVSVQQPIPLEDKQWVKVSGSFVAKEEATHLHLGQFNNVDNIKDILIGYYFIDDIRVEKFSDKSKIYTPSEAAPDGLDNIYFETDKYDLVGPSFETLNRVVAYLRKNPSLKLQIQGHTDNEGEDYHNQELSENRANSVYQYILNRGVDASRLQFVGYGSGKPVATNSTEDGRQQNRRVEFIASSKTMKQTSLDKVDVAEADNSYKFEKKVDTEDRTKLNNIGKYKIWECNKGKQRKAASRAAHDQLLAYKKQDAKSYILERSASEQVVFVNDSPEHIRVRTFFTSMLKDFYDQGYRYLGLEALDYYDREMQERGYPSINSGEETDEPMFGEMIRTALDLGFKVFPYDGKKSEIIKAELIVKREKGLSIDKHNLALSARYCSQGLNISRILKKEAGAKILIYTKGKNVREIPREGVKYTADWFRKFTNINPLTIEQSVMNERCFDGEEALYYTANVGKPTIYARKNAVLVQEEYDTYTKQKIKPYDIQVYHPRTKNINARPDFINHTGTKKIHSINLDKYQMQYPCLVYAYRADEELEIAVPVDIFETNSSNRTPVLLLEPGDYTLLLRDSEQRKKLEIKVE